MKSFVCCVLLSWSVVSAGAQLSKEEMEKVKAFVEERAKQAVDDGRDDTGPVKRRRVVLPPAHRGQVKQGFPGNPPQVQAAPVQIVFVNAPLVEAVIPLYERLTGEQIVVHEGLLSKRITAKSNGDLARAEAIDYLEASMSAQGIAIVEKDGSTRVLIPADGSGKLSASPSLVKDRKLLGNHGQRVVEYVLEASGKADPEKLRTFLADRLELLPFGRLDVAPDGKSLVIRERAAVIRRMLELVDAME